MGLVLLRFIHTVWFAMVIWFDHCIVFHCIYSSTLLLMERLCIHPMYHTNRHLGCFYNFAIINSAAVLWTFLYTARFYLWYVPMSEIAEPQFIWLPILLGVKAKVLTVAYNSLHHLAPFYVSEFVSYSNSPEIALFPCSLACGTFHLRACVFAAPSLCYLPLPDICTAYLLASTLTYNIFY